MQNYVKSGTVLTFNAPRALASGDGCLFGSIFGVACFTAALNAEVEIKLDGVFVLPKVSAQSWAPGDPIYWNDTAKTCNNAADGTLIGVATAIAANPSATGSVRLNSGYYPAVPEGEFRSIDLTLTAAQVKALNAAPIDVIAAPGAGKAVVVIGAVAFLDFATAAYDGVAAGEDLTLRYTDGNGAQLATFEATGFLDQNTDQVRYAFPVTANITPVADAKVVAHMTAGEIATGDSPVKLRVYYRVIPTAL